MFININKAAFSGVLITGWLVSTVIAEPLSTAFTYQGQLKQNGAPMDGAVDVRATLFDASVDGSAVGSAVESLNVAVVKGLFSTPLDFGVTGLNGDARWLQIEVRSPAGSGDYAALSPRQELTAAPYALQTRGMYVGPDGDAVIGGDMRINGGLGIGIDPLSAKLRVSGVTDLRGVLYVVSPDGPQYEAGLQVFGGNDTDPGDAYLTLVTSSSSPWSVGVQKENGIFAITNQSLLTPKITEYAVAIANNRYVGIGTSMPSNRLSVAGNGDFEGNVGIGTTSASFPLTVARLGHGIYQKASDVEVGTYIGTPPGQDIGGWLGTRSTHKLYFYTANSHPQMTLDTFGRLGIGTTSPTTKLDVNGEITCTVFNITSDRNAKEEFTSVDTAEILAEVVNMPITQWQYKSAPGIRHIGPMAQDFHEAFSMGRDDKHIAGVDMDGVALAAIQGLHAVVQEKDEQINALQRQLLELSARLDQLDGGAGDESDGSALTN